MNTDGTGSFDLQKTRLWQQESGTGSPGRLAVRRLWQWVRSGGRSGRVDARPVPRLAERLGLVEGQTAALQQQSRMLHEVLEGQAAALRQELQALREEGGQGQAAALRQELQALREEAGQGQRQLETTLQDGLAALEKQVSKAGREQFKANALAESQAERLGAALDLLRTTAQEAEERARAEQESLRQQAGSAQTAARLAVVERLLPVLDGLDEALRAGRRVLAEVATRPVGAGAPFQPLARPVDPARSEPNLLEQLRRFFVGPLPVEPVEPVADDGPDQPPPPRMLPAPDADAQQDLRAALDAWLIGLTFVRQRLLDVLGAEDVWPIEAEGLPFDPQLHMALDVVPARGDLLPGTVASELRRGYLVGGRVLRHAEVAVAQEPGSASRADGAD